MMRVPSRWRWWATSIAIAVVAYGLLGAFADVRNLAPALDRDVLLALFWAIVLGTAGFAVRAARWHAVLGLAGSPVPWRTSVPNFLIGLGMGLTPGKAAELLKIHYLRRRHTIRRRIGIASIMSERLGDGVGVLAMVAVAAPDWRIQLACASAALTVLILAMLARLRIPAPAVPEVIPMGFIPRMRSRVTRVVDGMRNLLRPLPLILVSVTGCAAWILETTGMYLVANALGLNITWSLCAFAYGVGSALGYMSFLPGGIGVTEFSVTAILVAAGVAAPEALLLTLGVRTATLWWGIAVGGATLAGFNMRARKTAVAALASVAKVE